MLRILVGVSLIFMKDVDSATKAALFAVAIM